jgi:hypothetical protein
VCEGNWVADLELRVRRFRFGPSTLNLQVKVKGPGAVVLPARVISTKNKHLLVIYSIPTRGFTAVVSVFGGTPSNKPFGLKLFAARLVRSLHRSGTHSPIGRIGAHRTGRRFDPTAFRFDLALGDIIEMSRLFRSQSQGLSVLRFTPGFRATKNPAYTG